MSLRLQRQAPSRPPAWLIACCLLAVYVIWGTTYFAIKVAIEGAPPFFMIGTRFLVAGSLLLAWQALRGRPMPTARQWRGAALVGFLLLVVGNGGVAVAEHWVSSGATVANWANLSWFVASVALRSVKSMTVAPSVARSWRHPRRH